MTVLNSEQIEAILPHKSPLLMVDSLLSVDEDRITTAFEVRPDNYFLKGSELSGYGLIEHMAQSGAVGLVMLRGDKPVITQPTSGFLAGLSKLKVNRLPRVGDTIRTVITPIANLGGRHLINAKSYTDNQLLISCQIKLTIQIERPQ